MNQGFQSFLREWYRTPSGKRLHQQERQLIEASIVNLFGYYFVQLGCPVDTAWLEASRIQDKIVIDASSARCPSNQAAEHSKTSIHWVCADLDYLPLAREAADVILLPHTLETVQDPYYLLRQADTALMPEGYLVLSGFNPFACGVIKSRLGKEQAPFREANLVRSQRVVEWLEVLGYDIEAIHYSTISCYTGTSRAGARQGWRILERVERGLGRLGLQFGNVYCIVARKRVDAPRMVGLSWKKARWWNFGKAGQMVSNRYPADHRGGRKHASVQANKRSHLAND